MPPTDPALVEGRRVPLRVWLLAALAMSAFAANSVLARLALDDEGIDPGTFTLLRLVSGAVVLALLVGLAPRGGRSWGWSAGSWPSAGFLLTYAATFSYAYVSLGAATGALVLFGVVQAVMFTAGLRSGERPGAAGWSGLAVALVGLVLLVGPVAATPDPVGALLMMVAGAAWAGYTLRGRGAELPTLVTAGNFLRSVPLALLLFAVLLLVARDGVEVDATGTALACLSGGVASGLGYALWYRVLPWLTRVRSGIIQLSPAPLAALAGLVIIGEPITLTLVVASVLILGGVLIGLVKQAAAGPG